MREIRCFFLKKSRQPNNTAHTDSDFVFSYVLISEDGDYIKDFLYSFRGLIGPIKLFNLLIERCVQFFFLCAFFVLMCTSLLFLSSTLCSRSFFLLFLVLFVRKLLLPLSFSHAFSSVCCTLISLCRFNFVAPLNAPEETLDHSAKYAAVVRLR